MLTINLRNYIIVTTVIAFMLKIGLQWGISMRKELVPVRCMSYFFFLKFVNNNIFVVCM